MRTSDSSAQKESLPGRNSTKRKKIKLPANSRLNKKIIYELESLMEFAPPGQLSKNIRNVFFTYLYHEKDQLPEAAGEVIEDVQFLLNFLDVLREESGAEGIRS